MPTFCRHGRLEANCPICSKKERVAPQSRTTGRRPATTAKSSARRRSPTRAGDLHVRRMARAQDDGYDNWSVPGLRATVEAARLADEIAFAVARLDELSGDPPGAYAEAAGEASLTPQRRFDRAFERLALPGMHRAQRYEFLLIAGRLGLLEAEASSLLLGAEPTDPTVLAAKRILGIGDAINLGRRASELAAAAGVPIAALDLAFVNWNRPEDDRIGAGSRAAADPAVRERVGAALGI